MTALFFALLVPYNTPTSNRILKGMDMEDYKREFIEFMVESNVLKFGDFTLKSGRKSPFFMNAGAYVTGDQLHRLGLYYAKAIHQHLAGRHLAINTYAILGKLNHTAIFGNHNILLRHAQALCQISVLNQMAELTMHRNKEFRTH